MSAPCYFTLDDDKAVQGTTDFDHWMHWMMRHCHELEVAATVYPHCQIMTRFLGTESHAANDCDGPHPFETVIVGGAHDGQSFAACSWANARTNHARVSELLAKEALHCELPDEPSPFAE